MTTPNFMVIGFQIEKLHGGGGGVGRNSTPLPCQILKSPAWLWLKKTQNLRTVFCHAFYLFIEVSFRFPGSIRLDIFHYDAAL